jgi:hypothetical protein
MSKILLNLNKKDKVIICNYLQVIRFELMISTWKVEVIPLNYTCLF